MIVRWFWEFGDGAVSTEPVPKHTYSNPGVFRVDLTTTDEYGVEWYFEGIYTIYVYEYKLGTSGLLSGYSNYCFKHAIKPEQGRGIMPYGGLWLWPMILRGTSKGYNLLHENLCLVINSEDMKIYQIGIPELWLDRDGTYESSEIAGEAMLPEIESRYGNHENVRHIETHVSMRSFDERNYRKKEGYSEDGFRDGHKLDLEMYENGEQIVPASTLQDVNRNGDYAFLKELEAKRLQIKLKFSTSAFRMTKVEAHCQEIDFRTPPQLNDIPQKRWQKEFNYPDIWFSRNKPSVLINRADGIGWTGSGTVIPGPDGKQNTAFISAGLTGNTAFNLGDFTISAWLMGDGVIYQANVSGGGTVRIRVIGGNLEFFDGTDGANIVLLSSITSWILLTVMRRNDTIELYENGRLKLSQKLTGIRSYGGATIIGAGSIFDIRRNLRAITGDSLYYYYESILDGGRGFLP